MKCYEKSTTLGQKTDLLPLFFAGRTKKKEFLNSS